MYVYWIKRKHFTNYKEGYIGVTTKSLEERFKFHSKYVKKRSVVRKAIEKYDDIEIKLLFEGSKEDCLKLEYSLRPEKNIGWNLAEGGGLPPKNVKGSESSKKISQTLKNKGMCPYSDKTHSPEAKEKRRASMTGRKWFYEPSTGKSGLLMECPVGWIAGRPALK